MSLKPAFLSVMTTGAVLLSGCSPTLNVDTADAKDPKIVQAYADDFKVLARQIQNDPNYKRIPLDTQEQMNWFEGLTFLYWDGKITREQFISQGLERYPGHKASFEYVADRLHRR